MTRSSIVRIGLLLAVCAATVAVTRAGGEGDEPVRFNRDVRPILADRCFACHGPDAGDRQARLRLDRAEGEQGAYRIRRGKPAIAPGAPEESEVWKRITTDDEFDVMPPADSHKPPLDAEELEVLRRWIEQGAEYQEHWAFVPLARPAIAGVETEHPIDRLVNRRLESAGIVAAPGADRRTLIRRLSFDLTGLPPTREEIRTFLDDKGPGAYERLVERLLSSPRYGEHMARYWLDLVRYADTNGLHHDHFREMSPYRDWVIRSFNENLPYDEFVRQQLAGDLLPGATDDQRIASSFNRLHLIIDRGTMLPEESLARNVIDRVTAFGTVFLGLTLQCATCHDHKYDPIPQRDFYQLFAFFNNFDGGAETGGRSGADFRRGLQSPYLTFPTAKQEEQLAAIDRELSLTERRIGELKQEQADAAELEAQQAERKRLRREKTELRTQIAGAMVMRERKEVRPAYILNRGAYDDPGELVQRDTPAFLPTLEASGDVPSRLDLAEWLVAREHPLTARVAVNRFWQQLFGVGLVKTSEDFGTQGEWPQHLDLLDYLAVSFHDSGWDVKALLEHIVMSETYRRASSGSRDAFASDPENRLLARGSRYRMDAEMIRDQILATSGLLNPEMYGPSVKPPQPAGIWAAVTLPDSYPRTFVADDGDEVYRRSVYTFWKRGMPPPQMTILDAPTRESCIARRERTSTPLQALLLLNESEYLRAARHFALSTLAVDGLDERGRIDFVYETITSRLPSDTVRGELLDLLSELKAYYSAQPELAGDLCEGAELPADSSAGNRLAEVAAWTLTVSAVYNLDITRTRE